MATLDFKGKALVQNYHLTVKYHELVPKKDKSLTDKVRLDDNLIIHGDNLKALKALLPTYAGQVKCIYVDVPYNTGNEGWVYNDNVNSPMLQEWLGKAVDRDDLTRHDKWLCMILPRFKLLRELLAEDGAIFVSIDDNEVHHLRMLMDEVFGEENFKNAIVVRRGVKNVQSQFDTIDRLAIGHEYVLVYCRQNIRMEKLIHNLSQEEPGKWDTFWRGTDRPTMRYKLLGVEPKDGQWRWEEERGLCAVENYKKYLKEFSAESELDIYWSEHYASTGEELDFVRLNDEGVVQYYVAPRSYRLISDNWLDISVRGSVTKFETEKSVAVVKRCIEWITSNDKEAIVLDSFSGSGTTAHAVLALNKEDGGNRKFILVECEDYADTITAERMRRVIKGVKGASDKNLKKGLGATFSYFELGKAIELDSILDGKNLPSYLELARYVFYTATGEEFDERKVNEKRSFVGESKTHEVYLFYQPDMDYLKKTALTLERAESLGKIKDKRRLVFAPTKYLDQEQLDALRIDFAQLPFEIYKLAQ